MVIELLGTRLIAPFYGASLYVWTSLISVTMIALALGYYWGGIWADKSRSGLSFIIAAAGILTLIIPWLTGPVLLATDSFGLRLGSFLSTLILFSPSLIMLGMIGPFAVKLTTSTLASVGASTGSIYAVSTIGSVIGTLFLGFYLFPLIGSREIFTGLGIALLGLAMAVALIEKRFLKSAMALTPTVFLAVAGFALYPQIASSGKPESSDSFKLQFERETLYGWVRVIDQPQENMRLLTADASTIGAASLSHGENILTYQKIVSLIPALTPSMKNALLIGQGAGHMIMTLKESGIVTDTLEIDPAIAEAASQFFGFQPTGRRIIGDARYEVRQLKGSYDLIILDVFTGGSEPAHLLTVEALAQLRDLLGDHGILALNFVGFYENGQNAALASVARTLAQVFPYQQAFISDPHEDFNDFIFLATRHKIDFNDTSIPNNYRAWLSERSLNINQTNGTILTDNLSNLEVLQLRKSEAYRRIIVDLVGTRHFIR